jgi:hypothetical protein
MGGERNRTENMIVSGAYPRLIWLSAIFFPLSRVYAVAKRNESREGGEGGEERISNMAQKATH